MDWDKLRIFHAVADAGSLTHAGDSLHLSQSAVSRQIRSLEESLNTTLFHRHARGLILTEQGELLFEATRAMNKRLDAAAAASATARRRCWASCASRPRSRSARSGSRLGCRSSTSATRT
jgi:DNA-binding transcriptional LysR family regulator